MPVSRQLQDPLRSRSKSLTKLRDAWRDARIPSVSDRTLHVFASLVVCALLLFAIPWTRMLRGENDFVHPYIGGLLMGTPQLYSPDANAVLQKRLIGTVLLESSFMRPPFYAVLLKPLTLLSYKFAYALFQFLSLASFAMFVRSYVGRVPELPILSLISVPLLSCFSNGQDVTLLVFLCAASLSLTRRKHYIFAGLVLSLCAIKGHLFCWFQLRSC
jgi:hypothetical protein